MTGKMLASKRFAILDGSLNKKKHTKLPVQKTERAIFFLKTVLK